MRIALLLSIIVLLTFAVCGEPVSPSCEPSTSYVPSVRAEGRAEQVGQIVIDVRVFAGDSGGLLQRAGVFVHATHEQDAECNAAGDRSDVAD